MFNTNEKIMDFAMVVSTLVYLAISYSYLITKFSNSFSLNLM